MENENYRRLYELMHDGDPMIRKSTIMALGKTKDIRAARDICSMLEDSNMGVRITACEALGRLGDPKSAYALVVQLRDNDVRIKATALQSLVSILAASGCKEELAKQLFAPMVMTLFDDNAEVRANGAATMGALQDGRAFAPLRELLTDEDAKVRSNAVWSLGRVATEQKDVEECTVILSKIICDGSEDNLVRIAAVDAGVNLGLRKCECATTIVDSCAEAAVQTCVDGELQATLVWGIGMLFSSARRYKLQQLIKIVADGLQLNDEWLCIYSLEALGRIGSKEALERAKSFKHDNKELISEGSRISEAIKYVENL